MNLQFNHAHLLPLLTMAIACSRAPNPQKVESSAHARPEQVLPGLVTFSGDLNQELDQIQNHEGIDPCDVSQAEIKRFLVTAVEEHQAAMKEEANESSVAESSSPHTPQARLIEFQGSHLVDLPKIATKSDGWTTNIQGWRGIHNFYKQNADKPTPRFWRAMNEAVRSLLLEDKIRVINGTNRGIDHENVQQLLAISAKVESCMKDAACEIPDFSDELALAVKSIPMYRFFYQGLRSNSDFESKREFLKDFLDRSRMDLLDHGFRKNPHLKFERSDSTTVLNLAMDPGLLGQREKEIIDSIIESVWSSETSKVKLDWSSKQVTPGLFEILFHPNSPDQRPYVLPYKKTMNLFPGNRTRSVAHEFGHVLGFDDHYYTVWDPDRCLYIYESNDFDLMSSSDSGDVTPEEWRTLLNLEEKPAS
jgi:hypothetical protein